MRVLVCGGRMFGRTINGYGVEVVNPVECDLLYKTLEDMAKEFSKEYVSDDNWLPLDITIISGAAKGADTLAADWAAMNWTHLEEYPADWKTYGRAAGYKRNVQMLTEGKPDLVIAFPGGTGTDMMCRLAEAVGVEVRRIDAV